MHLKERSAVGQPTESAGRHTVDLLTGGTMTVLGIQWLLTAQLILDFAAMTACFVADFEVLCLVMYSIGSAVFPRVELSFGRALVTIVAIGVVGSAGHVALTGMQEYLVQARDWSCSWSGSCS